ncbi:MAG: nucleotide 5'-monophosphate nucleosidase PpnN [Gammaproteobacteria bacterium]
MDERFPTDPQPRAHEERVDAVIGAEGALEVLSQREVAALCDRGDGELHELFRRCALAVLNSGAYVDDARSVYDLYRDFDIRLTSQQRGLRVEIARAPAQAFVDGTMIRGIREHLFAVLRDILYAHDQILHAGRSDLSTSAGITDAVFNILRNAGVLRLRPGRSIVVCWGGHSIPREEYDYTKEVGYELGLRGCDICTGCGPGAMKGPMKGATIGHAKQRIADGRYIGVTEPGIIAAEAPNPIVNDLVILPDMEKRLEAFVRIAHAIVIFPGGAGTAEELLYLAGVLMHPRNREVHLPVVLTGPPVSADYFHELLGFVRLALGDAAVQRLRLVVGDPRAVAQAVTTGAHAAHLHRQIHNDAEFFSWRLAVDHAFQVPFQASHAEMASTVLSLEQAPHERAVALRRVFTGIVAGNVKDAGIRAVERHGPYLVHGDAAIMKPLDRLLAAFAAQGRMKLPGNAYRPCYRLMS